MMVTVPAVLTGEVAVQLVMLHETPVAAVDPKLIEIVPAPLKLSPDKVTDSPPTVKPLVGETDERTGAA